MPYIYLHTGHSIPVSWGVLCPGRRLCIVSLLKNTTVVVPVMNGHPRDQAKVSVHCRCPLIRGNLTLKCVGRGIDHVAVQGRWPRSRGGRPRQVLL